MKNILLENLTGHDITSDQYYCYLLLDPTDRRVFYVGKGKRRRFRDHVYTYNSKNQHKINTVQNIIKNHGFYIVQIVYSAKDEEDAYRFEKHLVLQYPNLTNKTEGGDGAPSKPCRPVKQYNLYGEYIQTFASYYDAAVSVSKETSVPSQILECCRGATATCCDFYWSWADSKILKPRTKILPVIQSALDGTYITRFVSAAEAGRVLNCDGRDILVSIRKGGTSQGFRWSFHPIANA